MYIHGRTELTVGRIGQIGHAAQLVTYFKWLTLVTFVTRWSIHHYYGGELVYDFYNRHEVYVRCL